MLCDYNCWKPGLYVLKNWKNCCSSHYCKCTSLRHKNSEWVKKAHSEWKMYEFSKEDIQKSHTKQIEESKTNPFRLFSGHTSDYLSITIRKHNLLEYKCSTCNIDSWNGKKLVLELDHINWNHTDNRLENLRFLCPNCHSQTDTFRGRNKNSWRVKVSDEVILKVMLDFPELSIRQYLIKVWLVPKWGNYNRIYNLKKTAQK